MKIKQIPEIEIIDWKIDGNAIFDSQLHAVWLTGICPKAHGMFPIAYYR